MAANADRLQALLATGQGGWGLYHKMKHHYDAVNLTQYWQELMVEFPVDFLSIIVYIC